MEEKKSNKKGIIIGVVIVVVILIGIVGYNMTKKFNKVSNAFSGMQTTLMVNNLDTTETKPQYTYETLNNMEKLAYYAVKELYNKANDEENLIVNSIYCQQIDTDTNYYYKININCTGKNAFNATVKNCYIYRSSSSILGSEMSKNWITIGTKLNKEKIMAVYNNE